MTRVAGDVKELVGEEAAVGLTQVGVGDQAQVFVVDRWGIADPQSNNTIFIQSD